MKNAKLFHDHNGRLTRLHAVWPDVHVREVPYTRWVCRDCETLTLVLKEMASA